MRYLTIILATFAFVLLGGGAAFAQACKGLSKSACERNDGCSHVAAFTRKDGARVKAFCRSKPGARRASTRKASASSSARRSTERRSTTRRASTRKAASTPKASGTRKASSERKSASKSKTSKRKTTKRRTSKRKNSATAGS